MSDLFIPFNFQPASVSVKTGSYTIPVGSYARVSVSLKGASTFTINAVTALESVAQSGITSSTMVSSIAGLGALATGGGAPYQAAYGFTTEDKLITADYWVPTGTVINGTGTWRATVQLYNELT